MQEAGRCSAALQTPSRARRIRILRNRLHICVPIPCRNSSSARWCSSTDGLCAISRRRMIACRRGFLRKPARWNPGWQPSSASRRHMCHGRNSAQARIPHLWLRASRRRVRASGIRAFSWRLSMCQILHLQRCEKICCRAVCKYMFYNIFYIIVRFKGI